MVAFLCKAVEELDFACSDFLDCMYFFFCFSCLFSAEKPKYFLIFTMLLDFTCAVLGGSLFLEMSQSADPSRSYRKLYFTDHCKARLSPFASISVSRYTVAKT